MSKMKVAVRGTKKQPAVLYQREIQKYSEMQKRHQELLRDKSDWTQKLHTLKMISAYIIHNSASCPNGQDKPFEQYQTNMTVQPQLSDNRPAQGPFSPKFQINKNRLDDAHENTHTYLNERESATRMKHDHDRKISDKQLTPDGRKVPQQKGDCTFGETHEQTCTPDIFGEMPEQICTPDTFGETHEQTCTPDIFGEMPEQTCTPEIFGETHEQTCTADISQNPHICHRSANSFSGNERGDLAVPTGSVNLWYTREDKAPAPTSQAMTMSSGSAVLPECLVEMTHTQDDVLKFLQDSENPNCSLFAASGPDDLDDVMDTILKDCQPLKNRSQDHENLHSSGTSYSVSNSSSRSEADHYRSKNIPRKRTVVTRQACIKPHTIKSKAKIDVHTEDAVVEKSHAKKEMEDADSVIVLRQKVECLTIDDEIINSCQYTSGTYCCV